LTSRGSEDDYKSFVMKSETSQGTEPLTLGLIKCTYVQMNIVCDTNVFLAVILGEPERQPLISSTTGAELVAPAVLPFEVGNALTSLVKRRRQTPKEAAATWESFLLVPVELREIDLARAIALATENNVYAYDAYVVQCAIECKAPLLTLDEQMKRLALNVGVKLHEVIL
jgi:predicted nucleic acid-binding protein